MACLAAGLGLTSLRPAPEEPDLATTTADTAPVPAAAPTPPRDAPSGRDLLPARVAAPQVVEQLLGDLAEDWTFERTPEEATLTVQVRQGDMTTALARAAGALRTPEGRQSWDSLGANRLELQSGDLALHLSVTTLDGPW